MAAITPSAMTTFLAEVYAKAGISDLKYTREACKARKPRTLPQKAADLQLYQ